MTNQFVHVGYRQRQQAKGLFTSEIWNYYGLEFNVLEARRRGNVVEKVYANCEDQACQALREERRRNVVKNAAFRLNAQRLARSAS